MTMALFLVLPAPASLPRVTSFWRGTTLFRRHCILAALEHLSKKAYDK